MALSSRQNHLLQTDRWEPLRRFVELWYAEPLSQDSGVLPEEIDATVERLGAPLPVALTEWFELVGRRLRNVQDAPRRLDQIEIGDGTIDVWVENQGVWSICAPMDEEDPLCRLDRDTSFVFPATPLSRTLLGMVVSDTLVGAWAGSRIGPLGTLGPSVRGGYHEQLREDQRLRLREAYDDLPFPYNPFYDAPVFGNEATIIRRQPDAVEWMTATEEAFSTLDELLELNPIGGNYEVVCSFENLSDPQMKAHTAQDGTAKIESYRVILGRAGHLWQAYVRPEKRQVILHITTKDPQHVKDLLLAELSGEMKRRLTIAARPMSISLFDVLHPEGKDSFVLSE